MTITEATHVTRLLRILDGSYTGRGDTAADQLVESIDYLADRAGKPLQVTITPDLAEARSTAVHLLQRHADTVDHIDLGQEVPC